MHVSQLVWVIVYAEDVNAQVAFYRDVLGLEVVHPKGKADYRDESWVTLDSGACKLAIHRGGKRRLGEDAPKIAFLVSDVRRAREELVQRGVQMGELRSPAPGVWVSDGFDPEGNKFSIESHE